MNSLTKTFRDIGFLTIALTLALTANFAYGQWANPPASPPNGNIAAPVHTGPEAQVKNGSLSVDKLTVFGRSYIESTAPTIEFADINHNDLWWHANDNSMYMLADRNDDGSWIGENPWPLQIKTGAIPEEDFLRVSNQVRAGEYCDRDGANCFSATTGGTDAFGANATWQNVSRTPNSEYKNQNREPIEVYMQLGQSINHNFDVSADGSNWITLQSGDGDAQVSVSAIIPPGTYYRATGFTRWHELGDGVGTLAAAAPPQWQTGAFGSCSQPDQCSLGSRTRSVVCFEAETSSVIADVNCTDPKPPETQGCGSIPAVCEGGRR
jgi:hypothetical protein